MSAEKEIPQRLESSAQLVEDFNLHSDTEFFSDPHNRVEFLKSLEFDDFYSVAQHVNARTRNFEPRDGKNKNDRGAFLPMLRTPERNEKLSTLRAGFDVISKYIHESDDTDEQKLKGVGMATEALIIWVHPFNDGNGRTSRFLGKFIEDGTTDTNKLIAETADGNERLREYSSWLRVDDTTDYDNSDLMMDDYEIEQRKNKQAELSVTDGITQSLDRLLKNKSVQERLDAQTENWRTSRAAALERQAQREIARTSETT